jgi:hypothetical protein
MATMIPSEAYGATTPPGEIEVFTALRDDPETEGWVVLHSLDIVNHRDQISGEIDFVVLIPSKGVLCVEVKSHSFIDLREGRWFYGRSDRTGSVRSPFRQVSTAMYALQEKVNSRLPGLNSVPFATCVIFTNCEFNQSSEEWHDWEILDARKLGVRKLDTHISKLLTNVMERWRDLFASKRSAAWFNPAASEPTGEQVKVLTNFLRPSFEIYESPRSQASRRKDELKRFTDAQFRAIDAMSGNKRVVFEGPAGTGKTLLAIEAARRAASGERKVLLLCFNNLLGSWLEKETEPLKPWVQTGTIHKHMLDVVGGVSQITSSEPGFWTNDLPTRAIDALLERNDSDCFDELIIDEAQDILRSGYLDFLELRLKGGLTNGKWRLFGDFEKQAIYGAASITLEDALKSRLSQAPIFSLRENCRNRPRVAEMVHLLGSLKPGYSQILRPDDGYEPKILYYKNQDQEQEMLIAELANLYREGFSANDIVILSPRAPANSTAAQVGISPWKERLRPISTANESQIPYTSIQAFKGLEAGAVIVTDIESVSSASDLFYIAVTRALHRLVLLISGAAKTDVLNTLLGITEGEREERGR